MSSAVVVSSENLDGQQQSSSTPASPAAEKVNLLGMSRAELEKFFEDIGEKVSCRSGYEMDSSILCY